MQRKIKKTRIKQRIALGLIISLGISGFVPSYAAEEGKEIQEEMVNEEEQIYIRTEEDLKKMAKNCTLDSFSAGKVYVLQNDISITDMDFLPIATFGGIFDGNGHTISGINMTGSLSPAGLFATIQKDGVVKNLNVIGRVDPSGEAQNTGGICGVNGGLILNCSFKGYVKGNNNAGGIAGINEDGGEIRNCTFDGDVLGSHSTGGIAGSNGGTIFACENQGDINISGEDVESKMTELSLTSLFNFNRTENLSAHTDTGGIAGFSEGKIYYCINSGTVGYPHVGYNVGGIAGRCKQSYIQNCSNVGTVLGRKDVGGITGQIEPLLEVEYLKDQFQILDEETDKFIDLMEKAYSSLEDMNSQAFTYLKDISYYINTASTAAGGFSSASQDYYDSLNQGMAGMSQGISDLQKDMEKIEWDKDTDNTPSVSGNGILPNRPSVSGNGILPNSPSLSGNDLSSGFSDYENEIKTSKDALDSFLETTGEQASSLNDSSVEYGEDMKYHLSAVHANLEQAGKKMDSLSQILIDGTGKVDEDMSAAIEQAKVLRRTISGLRDDMFSYEEPVLQDASDEKASDEEAQMGAGNINGLVSETVYDTDSFQKGKVIRCLNSGTVEADINVGGIAGVMATEYDVDPEDDIEVVGDTSLKTSRRASVVIRDSRNEGKVSAKKDCVGGIAGKADIGAVISCEGYGIIESSNGNYVGGIVGKTAGIVKNCYAKCSLSGDSYVGGIIGDGTDGDDENEESSVSNCYSIVEITDAEQFIGAIAGKEHGSFWENYFVSDTLCGINRVNYHLKAEPTEYETIYEKENLVKGFQSLTVKFVLEEEVLKTKSVQYGQSLSYHAYPEIPGKEGYYVVWDKTTLENLKNDTIVTATYVPYLMSAAGKECREDGRPIFLAEGEFKEEDVLTVTDRLEETRQKGLKNNNNAVKEDKIIEHWVLNIPDNSDREEFMVHYLKDEAYKKVKIYVYEDKQWKKILPEEEGSYYLFTVKDSRCEIVVTQ